VAALALACNDVPTAPEPAQLVLVQAPSAAGAPGWELLDTLKVRAVNADGTPRAGVTVIWSIREGGGSVAPAVDTTGADGLAAAVWTLGAVSGANQARASTLEDAQVDFRSGGEAFRVDRMASGWGGGCGLVGGALWCWPGDSGAPSHAPQFGAFDAVPSLVDDSRTYTDVAVSNEGSGAVCALDGAGVGRCAIMDPRHWNDWSELTEVAGLPALTQVVGGGDSCYYLGCFCGLAASDSTAWCWEVGGVVVSVPGSPRFRRIWMESASTTSMGINEITACGLLADSTAACWGAGPLGDGSTNSSAVPLPVAGGRDFAELAVGARFACGRTAGGEVWCWGRDYTEHFATSGPPDVLLPELQATGVVALAANAKIVQVIAIGGGGPTRWWGAVADEHSHPTGIPVSGVIGFSDNNNASCVRLVDGQVYCWNVFWDRSSLVPIESYSPVQPLRSTPAATARR